MSMQASTAKPEDFPSLAKDQTLTTANFQLGSQAFCKSLRSFQFIGAITCLLDIDFQTFLI